jgi:succinate dehydrogenase flavin-adding protein (antitoxin of CptAB toxin-antitoxin module)
MRGSAVRLGRTLDIPRELNASLPLRRKKLLRNSLQRGMLENELIVGSYAIAHIAGMTEHQVDELEQVLAEQDPDLIRLLTKKDVVPEELANNSVLQALMIHAQENPLRYQKT